MFKNLLKTSFRSLLKEKAYTLINILGLTVGLTCSMFLLLYVKDELSFDKYHDNAENIYRVVSHIVEPDNEFVWAVTQIPFLPEVLATYPEVKDGVRFFERGRQLYKHGNNSFFEERTYLADSNVFNIFSYNMFMGDPSSALTRPNTIVLTESMAKKYFGEENPLGQTIIDGRNETLEVTGVIRDVPENSHFIFDALISKSTFPDFNGGWGGFGVFCYIVLPDDYSPDNMIDPLAQIVTNHVDPIFASMGIQVEYQLQRITDIHLKSKIQDEAESGGDMSYIYIFTAVAIFILLIACINYMNLATARSSKRVREVGIRKVVGANQGQLIIQFLSESVLLAIFAMVISLGLFYLLLPQFNQLSGKNIQFLSLMQFEVVWSIIGITMLVGVLSGAYPSFFLARYKPTDVLTSSNTSRSGNKNLRRGLVIFQFFISVVMLISTMLVYRQLDYLRNKDLGFNQDQVVLVELSSREIRDKFEVLRNKFLAIPDVSNVATASSSPGNNVGKSIGMIEDNKGEMLERGIDLMGADYDFVSTMGMHIQLGRDFSRDYLSDTSGAALVNEAMVARMSWDEPLGKKFQFGDGEDDIFRVVGVIRDYHQNSLYDLIEPLFIYMDQNQGNMFIKLQSGSIQNALTSIENVWKEVIGTQPFQYRFLDEDFNSQYQADEKRGKIFTIFSGLTILIACLGLIGLASYSTEQRTREIGIRKAIGASRNEVMVLLGKEFAILNLVAIIISIPVAYYLMDKWLQSFSYRIEIANQVPIFIIAGVGALAVTFLSVAYHTISAANANPVNSLREE